MPRKPCSTAQIVNPLTGRCVKKDGKIGKAILAKSTKSPSPIRTKSPSPKSSSKGSWMSFTQHITLKLIKAKHRQQCVPTVGLVFTVVDTSSDNIESYFMKNDSCRD